jgi:AraC-like DNA-binding protein
MSINRFQLSSEANHHNRHTPQLIYITAAKYEGDWECNPHTHTCAEIFYITSGKGSLVIDEQTHPVGKDDLVVINPRVQHTEISNKSQPLDYIVLGVEGMELSVGNNEQQFHIISCGAADAPLRSYVTEMLQEMEAKASNHELLCQRLLEVLLIRVMRHFDRSARMVPSRKKVSKECAAARRYIDSHFRDNLTLDQLAEIVHINKYHMVHSFTKAYGVSPINYLLSLRLQESRYLLQSTDHSMAQISQMVGFSSPCYFSQVFHKAMGMSPREYRNSCR